MTALEPSPVMLGLFENFIWLSKLQGEMTEDNLTLAMARVGRVPAVQLLGLLHEGDKLTPELATKTVGPAWSMSELPDRSLRRNQWRSLFKLAGYTQDGVAAVRPTETLTLYRGSVPERCKDWSWTDNFEVARRYAGGEHYRRPQGNVWVAQVPPSKLLARNLDREEFEYIVDTARLKIELLE